jgi:hypothetical protein
MARGGWFRMYDELLDDPKVQKLPGGDFKAWVNLLCLARRNEGFLPPVEDIAFALRIDLIGARSLLDRLAIGGLIDSHKGGPNGARIAPHGWHERQYKSDTSSERVKRFRERYKDVSETPPETETEKSRSNRANGAARLVFEGRVIRLNERDFEQWEKAFPDLNLRATLQARDDWLVSEADDRTRKRWFISTSTHLKNLQQDFTAAKRERHHDRDRITV